MNKLTGSLILLYVVLGFGVALVLVHNLTDPAQQVRHGIEQTREACAAGLADTPAKQRACALVQ